MSEQSKTCTEDNDLHLSVYKVLSNDDLLIEILKRLPFISLHFCKFVSKQWLSLINSPLLVPRYRKNQKTDPPSGFFLESPSSSGYHFVSLDSRITKFSLNRLFIEAGSDFVILDSCNGLLLCCIKPDKYYVYNPTVNVFKMIPQCDQRLSDVLFRGVTVLYRGVIRLAFDPTKSPYYKVYCIRGSVMETYSSETGDWSAPIEAKFMLPDLLQCGVYWKNIFYGTYSVCTGSLWMFVVGEHYANRRTAFTPFSPLKDDGSFSKDIKVFESCGYLYVVGTSTRDLPIYEMRKRYSEWSLKYVVNLDDIVMLLDEKKGSPSKWDLSRIWGIVMGEREDDSFLVMELYGKVVEYNIGLKSIREVYDLRSIITPDIDLTKLRTFQFIASSASV